MSLVCKCVRMGNARSSRCELVSLGMPQRERDLHLAVMGNDKTTVQQIVSQGVDLDYPWSNPAIPSIKDSTTPLLAAVSLNHVDISHMLLQYGAAVNRTDRNGCTPLYKAAYHGRPVLVDMLVKAGAEVDKPDKEEQTALHICVQNAIVHSSYAAVERLLAAGASVNVRDLYGRAPIHIAAHWKIREMLRLLIAAGSEVDLVDGRGRTPLYVVVSSLSTGLYKEDLRYQVPCIKLLFSHGCDMLNLVDWLKWKGPGIPEELLADDENFFLWYKENSTSPLSLRNLSRKIIQHQLCRHDHGRLLELIQTLPLPPSLHVFLSRKMFHHDIS